MNRSERITNRFLSNLETRLDNLSAKPLKSNDLGARLVGPAGLEPATRRL